MSKQSIFIIGIVSIFICICSVFYLVNKVNTLNERLSDSENNIKTLLIEKNDLDSTSRILKLTIQQLEYSKDSISRILTSTLNKHNINKKKISQLQYMLATNFRVDTIRFTDTLFVNNVNIDTLITDDKWYTLDVKLRHPKTIIINPNFKNEYSTVFSHKKETINPPRKFFLWRLFQKKHVITEVKVFNNNPYSSIDTTRFIDIVKR